MSDRQCQIILTSKPYPLLCILSKILTSQDAHRMQNILFMGVQQEDLEIEELDN